MCLALGVAHQATDPACQSLDEGVAGVAFAVEPFDLQQLPLQVLSKAARDVALQLRARTHTHRQL